MPRSLPTIIGPILLVLTAALSCAQEKAGLLTKKYPPEAIRQDIRLLDSVVMKLHPGIGIYCSAADMQAGFSACSKAVTDSITQREFRLQLKLLLDQLHCGHTEVLYSKPFYKQLRPLKLNYSPLVFVPVENKVYVLGYLGKKQDSIIKKGTQVTQINGITVDSMLRHSARYISSDGLSMSGKQHYVQLAFNSVFPALFGRPDTFDIQFLEGNQLKQAKFAAVQLKSMPVLPLGAKDDSLFRKFKQAAISYRYLDSAKTTMLMKISKFSHVGDKKAYRKLFRKLQKNNCTNLVIDLRNNGGGSIANSYRLLSYLLTESRTQTLKTRVKHYPYRHYTRGDVAFRFTRFAYKTVGTYTSRHDTDVFVYTIKPKTKNHFNGKVVVLINGGSFSASCLVASYLKASDRAVFIGEETGGGEEGCNAGITPYYRLPNTGIQVRLPAFRVEHDVCPQPKGHGVMPDIETKYRFKDIVTRRDLDILKVKELLNLPE